MVSPSSPWPRPGRFDDVLSEIVASGNVQQARDYFDKVFWESQQDRPGWKHLRLAVLKEDRAMIRLLATWGAHPSEDELAHFRAVTGEKYPAYVRLMRQGGLRSNGQPWEDIVPEANVKDTEEDLVVKSFVDNSFADHRFEKIPREWLLVLAGIQQAGATEAVIAGGALRDLFNNRAVKDVDIFLRSQGSEKKNRKFLAAAFEASGVKVQEQRFTTSDGYGTSVENIAFPAPNSSRDVSSAETTLKRERTLESWKVMAGANTEYNVIFVTDNLDEKLLRDSNRFTGNKVFDAKSIFVGGLLEAFDTALSQIATDGSEIVSTQGYKEDVRNKRITLSGGNTTEDHLKRIVAKYPDFEPSPEVKARLAPKPQPRHRGGNYGWY